MNFFLIIIALFLLAVFSVPAFLFELTTLSYKKLNNWFLSIAISIDQFANVFCRHLLNRTLVKGGEHLFGNVDETISGVLGKNKRNRTLTKAGQFLSNLLDRIDKDHVIKSIEEDEK